MNPLEFLKYKHSADSTKKRGLITFINPYSYLFFRKNLNLFSEFDEILIDGIALVKLVRLIGVKTRRLSFDMTSLAPIVFKTAIEKHESIYFVGSTEKALVNFIGIIKTNYSELNIIGFRNGFFKDENERALFLDSIIDKNPDILVVGMGTPLQEMFLVDLKKKGWKGVGYTCGGFIHQTISKPNYYPKFYDKYNLRWCYRILDEPELIKRYFFLYPKSLFLFFLDFIKMKINKFNK
jgi:N-acetylglucosaminyldiphosphoundecaprenol N-acetyl-beta-D-mannosaminyltransferase